MSSEDSETFNQKPLLHPASPRPAMHILGELGLEDDEPAVIKDLVQNWLALNLWDGPSGIQRLKDLAATAPVQPMLSRQDQFIGDFESLMLLQCTFEDFLEKSSGNSGRKASVSMDADLPSQSSSSEEDGSLPQLYLAQCPILQAPAPGEDLQPGPLHALMHDIGIPEVLNGYSLTQINFWASLRATRSSLHYDPHHNLLCCVTGRKTVHLVPPSAINALKRRPPYHESANHAIGDLYQENVPHDQRNYVNFVYTLRPGDALFIPEGWWHQVDSHPGTIAVNFWWTSDVSQHFGRHMDRYYIRRLAQNLAESRKRRAIEELIEAAQRRGGSAAERLTHFAARGTNYPEYIDANYHISLRDGTRLISFPNSPVEKYETVCLMKILKIYKDLTTIVPLSDELRQDLVTSIEDTLFSRAAASMESLMRTMLALVASAPTYLRDMLLNLLSPAAWELLTTGVEQRWQGPLIDTLGMERAEEALSLFYDTIYSVVEDRGVLVEVMLIQKQAFSKNIMEKVLHEELLS